MNRSRSFALGIGLVAVTVLDILVYWNIHIYLRSQKTDDPQKKVEILGRAKGFFPFDDLVFYELGKAYFELGNSSLDDRTLSLKSFQNSRENFERSIKLNPTSYFGHFNLARSLDQLSFFDPALGKRAFEEYRKAARLAGQNSQVFFEVGKVLFSSWPQLSGDDREFCIDLLKKVGAARDPTTIQSLLDIWEMNVKDYKVLEKILPEDAVVCRVYARFLGEKNLSLSERQKYLAKAEALEFQRATNDYRLGENAFFHFQTRDALDHFNSCLNFLGQLRFYQDLAHQDLIDENEFRRLLKSAYLNRAKCRIEERGKLSEVESDLQNYLELEDELAANGELESYMREHGLISGNLESDTQDLDRLYFEVYLNFKQNRHRDNMRVGALLEQSFVVIPPEKKNGFIRILQIVGDSYQRTDYLYEASKIYQRALELDPLNLKTLIRIRQSYERLNENEKLKEINKKIEQVKSAREMLAAPVSLSKGQFFSSGLTLDGRRINLEFDLRDEGDGPGALVSLFFNNRIVFEDYVQSSSFISIVESKVGENLFQFVPVNRPVTLQQVNYRDRE